MQAPLILAPVAMRSSSSSSSSSLLLHYFIGRSVSYLKPLNDEALCGRTIFHRLQYSIANQL